MSRIMNGHVVKDVITGFEGTVTGIVEYITGCRQCQVRPRVAKDGKLPDAEWFDEERLAVVNSKPIELLTPWRERAAAGLGFDDLPPNR